MQNTHHRYKQSLPVILSWKPALAGQFWALLALKRPYSFKLPAASPHSLPAGMCQNSSHCQPGCHCLAVLSREHLLAAPLFSFPISAYASFVFFLTLCSSLFILDSLFPAPLRWKKQAALVWAALWRPIWQGSQEGPGQPLATWNPMLHEERAGDALYALMWKENPFLTSLKKQCTEQCLACDHLFIRLKHFCKDTQDTSNHGYLFLVTSVGGWKLGG